MSGTLREIEHKYVVLTDKSLETLNSELVELLSIQSSYSCSRDTYWLEGKSKHYNFIRIRHSDLSGNGKPEITLKNRDKGSNVDRLELNLEINNSEIAQDMLTRLLGPAAGMIVKESYCFAVHDIFIGIYKVAGDSKQRIFFEVEAPSEKKVEFVVREIKKKLKLNLEFQDKSLAQLFLGAER